MEQLEGVPLEAVHANNYERHFILKVILEIGEGLPLQWLIFREQKNTILLKHFARFFNFFVFHPNVLV